MEIINVKNPSMEGKIYLGEGVIDTRLPALTEGKKCFVVTDSNVYALYSEWFLKWFKNAEVFILPAGEENKNFQSLYAILEKMAGAGMRRTSCLFAVGGGVVGLNNKYSYNGNHKHDGSNNGPLVQSSVTVGGLIFSVEGIRAACNGAGKTVFAALLKKNCHYDENGGKEKKYKKYVLKNYHFKIPFNIDM
jgi:hypothetical protein